MEEGSSSCDIKPNINLLFTDGYMLDLKLKEELSLNPKLEEEPSNFNLEHNPDGHRVNSTDEERDTKISYSLFSDLKQEIKEEANDQPADHKNVEDSKSMLELQIEAQANSLRNILKWETDANIKVEYKNGLCPSEDRTSNAVLSTDLRGTGHNFNSATSKAEKSDECSLGFVENCNVSPTFESFNTPSQRLTEGDQGKETAFFNSTKAQLSAFALRSGNPPRNELGVNCLVSSSNEAADADDSSCSETQREFSSSPRVFSCKTGNKSSSKSGAAGLMGCTSKGSQFRPSRHTACRKRFDDKESLISPKPTCQNRKSQESFCSEQIQGNPHNTDCQCHTGYPECSRRRRPSSQSSRFRQSAGKNNIEENLPNRGNLNHHIQKKSIQLEQKQHEHKARSHPATSNQFHAYKCDNCNQSFPALLPLLLHLKIHDQRGPFKCDVCGKGYKKKLFFQKHVLSHSKPICYKCDICNKMFTKKGTLIGHVKNHTRDAAFKCTICGKGFKKKRVLYSHKLVHSNSKPYTCDICHATFKHEHSVILHKKSHSGIRPHKCDVRGEFNMSLA